jgi:hypothetical protein
MTIRAYWIAEANDSLSAKPAPIFKAFAEGPDASTGVDAKEAAKKYARDMEKLGYTVCVWDLFSSRALIDCEA